MKIWVLKDSEPLPLTSAVKPMRAAMLVDALLKRGHEVRWWCSTISHFNKTQEAPAGNYTLDLTNGSCEVIRIEAGLYKRNLSFARVCHHRKLAKRWRRSVEQLYETPDLILVAYPIIEWAAEALAYAKSRNIPVVVDVRDQWPDTFVNYVPLPLKPFVWLVANGIYRDVGALFRKPKAITSMSTPVLRWALEKAGRIAGDDTRVFYLGTAHSKKFDRQQRSLQPGQVMHCAFLGTLGHTSDVLTIAHAARILHQQNAPVRITIAGDGDKMCALRSLVADLPNVTLPGWCETMAATQLLQQADMALLTGHNEAMPNRFFDYIAAGLPIVCSLRGEVRDYITTHRLGACCPSGDAQALAYAILQVYERYTECAEAVAAIPESVYAYDVIYSEFAQFLEQAATH